MRSARRIAIGIVFGMLTITFAYLVARDQNPARSLLQTPFFSNNTHQLRSYTEKYVAHRFPTGTPSSKILDSFKSAGWICRLTTFKGRTWTKCTYSEYLPPVTRMEWAVLLEFDNKDRLINHVARIGLTAP